jgi:hypothetical protein
MESDDHQDSLALRQERVVSEDGMIREEVTIPVSEEISSIPVSEDMDPISIAGNIPVSEDMDPISVAGNIPDQSSQEEVGQQDLTVASGLSVLTDQEHPSPSNVASIPGRVPSSSLQPSGGGNGKRSARFTIWLTILLVALVLAGLICWLLFSLLGPSANPWQSFSDTKLGFSVSYPADWQVQVDDKQSIVHFHDNTQTGKVDIAISLGATAGDVTRFLQQRASRLGMTNITTGPSSSFAGTSWQQVQGKLVQEGVSYSVTMLATMHGNHLYLLTQSSPQSTYKDEDTLIFSAMRAGLRFL